jgi:very-short-patch-repair endonuclease
VEGAERHLVAAHDGVWGGAEAAGETRSAVRGAMMPTPSNPPRNGEGDRSPQASGGGGPPSRSRSVGGEGGPLRLGCAEPPPRSGEDLPAYMPAVLRAPIKLVKRARRLRKEMSLPEVLLLRELKKRPGGFKFRPQCPVAGVSADFACLSARLVIEVDGEAHDREEQAEYDHRRDIELRKAGFRVMRIPAVEVLKNMEGVIIGVVAACNEAGPPPPSLRDGPPPSAGIPSSEARWSLEAGSARVGEDLA